MDRMRSLGTWILTAMVTLAAGVGLVAFDQSPQLSAVHTTNSSSPPSTAATATAHSPRDGSQQPKGQISIREAALPLVHDGATTTQFSPTTTSTFAPIPPTTTTILHQDGGDDGGGSDDGG